MDGTIAGAASAPAEGVVTFDQNGRVRGYDAAALALFGYTGTEFRDQTVGDLLPALFPGPPGRWRPPGPREAGVPRTVEGRRKDGSSTGLLTISIRDLFQDGEPLFRGVIRAGAASPPAIAAGEPANGRVHGLAALDQTLARPGGLPGLLDRVVETATLRLPASAGAVVALWDPERGEATVGAASTPTRGAAPGRGPRPASAIRWIVQQQRPLVVPNTQTDRFEARQMLPEFAFRAYAAVPIIADGRIFGALVALDREPRNYAETDVEFLGALATRAGLAIARANLLRQLQRAQEALRESEARFHTFVESMGEGILVCDLDNHMTYANSRLLDLSGYEAKDLIGQRVYELLLQPHEWPSIYRRTTQLLPEVANPRPFLLRRKDGSQVWIDLHASPLRNAAGTVVGTLAIVADVTERVQAEEALRASEDRYRSLFDQSLDAVVLGTDDGVLLDANAAAARIFGLAPDAMVGQPWSNFVAPDDARWAEAQSERARTGKFQGELLLRRADGSVFPGEISSVLFTSRAGAARSSLIIRDITERKQAEAALQRANGQLRRSVDELQGRTREVAILNAMGEMLQTCFVPEEAYDVIASFAARLFPGEAGALYLLNPAHNTLRVASSWGEGALMRRSFPPNDCWSMRQGRLHRSGGRPGAPPCGHVDLDQTPDALCVPMMAQGETVGIFYLQSPTQPRLLAESHQRVAVALAEHVGLSLANLRLRAILQSQAIRDPLTGLFNRRYMEESLEREIHRSNRSGRPLGIIMVDVDHFKRFNDTFGHAAGDRLLAGLGQFLQTKIRGADLACRYGGEEFLLILPETTRDVVRGRAEELRTEAKFLRVQYGTQTLGPITLSLGVATYPDQGNSIDAVVRAADEALYEAKTAGRDRVVISVRRKDLVAAGR